MKFAALILVFAACQSWAADEVPKGTLAIPTQGGYYYLNPARFRLGYTVVLMKSGYPIGQITGTPPALEAPDTPEEMNEQMEYAIDANTKNQSRISTQVADLQKGLAQGTAVAPTAPVQNGEAALEQESFDFDSCAKEALLLLKRKIQLDSVIELKELTGAELDNAVRTQAAVTSQLQRHRGAGGVACTRGDRYLDAVHLATDTDQIRALSALLMRTGSERLTLTKTLAIAYTPKYPAPVRSVWNALWIRQALVAAFSTDAIPSYAEIAKTMKAAQKEKTMEIKKDDLTISVPVVRDLTGIDERIQDGLKILEDGYAKP